MLLGYKPLVGSVLGPTSRIFASRAAPSRTRPARETDPVGEGMSDIPDKLSGVRVACATTSPVDSELKLVLALMLMLKVISMSLDKLTFSESERSLILEGKREEMGSLPSRLFLDTVD